LSSTIHDISRVDLSGPSKLPRFNMLSSSRTRLPVAEEDVVLNTYSVATLPEPSIHTVVTKP